MSDEPKNLFWLDRLNMHVPGHAGYQQPGERERADRLFREALTRRLALARDNIARTVQQCLDRNAEREVGALLAIDAELKNLSSRVERTAGPGAFEQAEALGDAKAESLHALDHALLDEAEGLVRLSERHREGHDWLAELKASADAFARKLDARAMLFHHFG
jgi:hypothetical protein